MNIQLSKPLEFIMINFTIKTEQKTDQVTHALAYELTKDILPEWKNAYNHFLSAQFVKEGLRINFEDFQYRPINILVNNELLNFNTKKDSMTQTYVPYSQADQTLAYNLTKDHFKTRWADPYLSFNSAYFTGHTLVVWFDSAIGHQFKHEITTAALNLVATTSLVTTPETSLNVSLNQSNSCQHDYVNVGFFTETLACRYCGQAK